MLDHDVESLCDLASLAVIGLRRGEPLNAAIYARLANDIETVVERVRRISADPGNGAGLHVTREMNRDPKGHKRGAEAAEGNQ